MGAWSYYSPLWLGALLVLVLNESVQGALPVMSPAGEWTVLAGIAALVGLECQVLMIGAQGAFAQVLPVPVGRSIRGRGAVVAGGLLMTWVVLGGVTVLLGYERVTDAAVVVGVMAVAALAGAIVVYVWELPAAVADFGTRDRR